MSLYVTEMPSCLVEWRFHHVGHSQGVPAILDFLKTNGMKRRLMCPIPLTEQPSDCYLLRYVKGCLVVCRLADEKEIFEGVSNVQEGIGKVILRAVFLEWMERFGSSI